MKIQKQRYEKRTGLEAMTGVDIRIISKGQKRQNEELQELKHKKERNNTGD